MEEMTREEFEDMRGELSTVFGLLIALMKGDREAYEHLLGDEQKNHPLLSTMSVVAALFAFSMADNMGVPPDKFLQEFAYGIQSIGPEELEEMMSHFDRFIAEHDEQDEPDQDEC